MRVLAIETSCDETAVALLSGKGDRLVLEANLVASQAAEHAQYGGVVPEVAARRHVDALFPLLEAAGVPRDGAGIDAVAVTAGPGLVPALRIGVEAAKTLALIWNKPLVAVNHLEGHVYSVWLKDEASDALPVFPALALLVSGGHTELVLMRDHGAYELLGKTRDDAAGEAFDKGAKLLGLPYPGGPQISDRAKNGTRDAVAFPRPMLESGDMDFSFSGLKTAVDVYLREQGTDRLADTQFVADTAASLEEAIVDVLAQKTAAAMRACSPKSLIVCGGVAANASLRDRLAKLATTHHLPLHVPAMLFTGDNAAMIAAAGYFRFRMGQQLSPFGVQADPNMRLAD